jgi:hypothetical protein
VGDEKNARMGRVFHETSGREKGKTGTEMKKSRRRQRKQKSQ